MARRVFVQLPIVCQLCPFLDLVLSHSFLYHLMSGLLLGALHGATLEVYSETTVGSGTRSGVDRSGGTRNTTVK